MSSWGEVLSVARSPIEPREVVVVVLIAVVSAIVTVTVTWHLCRHLRRATKSLWWYVCRRLAQGVCCVLGCAERW